MMNEPVKEVAGVPLKDKLSFRLGILFVFVFVVTFFGLWTYSAAHSFMESRAAEDSVVLQPKPVTIDPKIQTELTRVLALDAMADPVDVRDPFNDRAGISGLSASRAAVGSAGSPAVQQGGSRAPGQTINATGGAVTGGQASSVLAAQEVSATEATKERYEVWLSRARVGIDVQLDPRIFSIEDLLPVGIVDGGNGSQEVMFFSEAANRTVSFPVGTLFYDGWLAELRPEGVVFSFNDDRRTVRMRSWGRSLRLGS